MVFFKDNSSPSVIQHLVILDYEGQSIERGTIFAVFDPIVGRYATAWPRLTIPSYLEEWLNEIPSSKTSKTWTLQATHHQHLTELTPLPTLGRHIIEGQAKWGDDIKFAGEFHYIKGYWEWTEDILSRCKNSLQKVKIYDAVYASLFTYDNNSNIMRAFCKAWCPSTNTLLTSFGELSISLWDLHTLTGLPITGSLYDEVVPCAKELTDFDESASLEGVRGLKMMTFSGEGGAKYYDPTDARKRIHKGELVSLTCTMITKEKDFTYVDNGNAE
ncbi:hypothetical protein DH2020_004874 [Rehmannia glutinosa]|uniref:Aminotransferase-like plant mobile domain-containing protein n=1 Tax=Rehmannia glutinosa TaxID=99300 RepID=A0ABR0XQK0_REHGL